MKFLQPSLLASSLFGAVHGITHPGIGNSLSDLNTIKSNIQKNLQPWVGSFQALQADPMGSATYEAAPTTTITATSPARTDAAAAYLNALNWYFSEDESYLTHSISIINDYVNTVTTVEFSAQITAYFMAYKLSLAVEIVRLSSSWTATDQSNWNKWATNVLYAPVCNAGITGSVSGVPGDGNQGAGDLACVMAIGISTDNTTMYNYAVNLFKTNSCFGVTGYIDANGCTGEAGRDMAHPQGALESLSECAKMGELQGDTSLWSYGSNRLLTAWEWMAKRNLNNGTVPFTKTGDCYSQFTSLSSIDLGKLVPSYELPYGYYVSTAGLSMPYTAQVIQYHGPEIGVSSGGTGEDTLYATLLYHKTTNSTAPLITTGVYNIRPYAQNSLYVGAPSLGSKLTLATTATESYYFNHLGNNLYRISPSTNHTYIWDSGSTSGGAGSAPYVNGGNTVDWWQLWKVLPGSVSGAVSFVTYEAVTGGIPRTYAFITTTGGSGTTLTMAAGTSATTTTNTAQQYLIQSA